jgi:hypothetical protein
MKFILVEIHKKDGIIKLFEHECPEPVYDMLRKWQMYNDQATYEVMQGA